jgi:hypothetical protein
MKVACTVRGGAVGNVLTIVTRWPPTLLFVLSPGHVFHEADPKKGSIKRNDHYNPTAHDRRVA